MRVMIHKIHRSAELPSVEEGIPYFLYGDDFSDIEFPQNIRNCEKCHGEAHPFETIPSNAACTSCHDNVNVNTGENHSPGAFSDAECSTCHEPEGPEFGISEEGAHTIPQLSQQVPGMNFEIVSVRDAEDGDEVVDPSHHAQVIFNIKDNAGLPVDPSTMAFLRLTLAGPTTEFAIQDYNGDGIKTAGEPIRGAPFTSLGEDYLQQDARGASPVGDGNYSVTFSLPIPADAKGTYAVGMEGFKCAAIEGLDQDKGGINCTSGNTEFNEIRDAGFNVVSYFPVTEVEPVSRRKVVDTTKCVACHDTFSKNFLVHGGIRNNGEYCALCHNPSHDSLSRQPAPAEGETDTTFPVHFKVMIHKIHTGSDLENPYLIFVPSGAATNVQEFRFPGDRRNCEKCHLSETNLLRPDMGLATVTHERDSTKGVLNTFYTPPIKAACTGCHDGEIEVLGLPVSVHADMWTMNPNTPNAVEQCSECHSEGRLVAVSRVHARD
jgi:OmcA/MtrC family decaheme c-type cytochrome